MVMTIVKKSKNLYELNIRTHKTHIESIALSFENMDESIKGSYENDVIRINKNYLWLNSVERATTIRHELYHWAYEYEVEHNNTVIQALHKEFLKDNDLGKFVSETTAVIASKWDTTFVPAIDALKAP